ncbi:hypothetical protein [Nakamurella multipartita]|nr:hypothetical protein [Nakamurella multipartita]
MDIHATSPSEPLANLITEQLFVSGVGTDNIESV